jgi:hypothetical protein
MRYRVVTQDPEWVTYEWLIEADSEEEAESLEGDILKVQPFDGPTKDIDNMDRIIVSVRPAQLGD